MPKDLLHIFGSLPSFRLESPTPPEPGPTPPRWGPASWFRIGLVVLAIIIALLLVRRFFS